jgi:hypothetical protein
MITVRGCCFNINVAEHHCLCYGKQSLLIYLPIRASEAKKILLSEEVFISQQTSVLEENTGGTMKLTMTIYCE